MKSVWPVIKRYSEKGYLSREKYILRLRKIDEPKSWAEEAVYKHSSYGYRLLSSVKTAYQCSLKKHKPASEIRDSYNSLITQFTKLSKSLKNTGFDYSPRCYHPDYDKHADDGEKIYDDHLKGYGLANLLLKYAEDVEREKTALEQESQLLPYQNIKNPQRVAFIRALSLYFKKDYDGYLYRTLATISRVILEDENIGDSTVKDVLRNWSGDLNHILYWSLYT